jgi:beta-aspartyl-dipeptidase (metallo-type)
LGVGEFRTDAVDLALEVVSRDKPERDLVEKRGDYAEAEGLLRYLASGAPPERVTISSDAGGCLPCFDADGRVSHMEVGAAGALLETLRDLLDGGMTLEAALPAVTSNPARLLRLAGKGRIAAGADADLLALDATGAADTVIIRGVVHVRDGMAVRRGTFEAG